MHEYIWQLPNWSQFTWDEKTLLPLVSQVRLKQGRLIQKIQILVGTNLRQIQALVFEEETLKTAQIEGELYDPESVRSSVHRRLGLTTSGLPKTQRRIDGLVSVLFDATLQASEPLTIPRLHEWHSLLFSSGSSELSPMQVGSFRTDATGPMQVVSGAFGKEAVHFEAPPALVLPTEMSRFMDWWQQSQGGVDGLLRAGIAHFYFITLHPYDDGNGRLARALADMALAQDDGLAQRYYSMSQEVVKQRKQYYAILEQTQHGGRDITPWLVWFVNCFSNALTSADQLLGIIFAKADFWRIHNGVEINARQRKVLNVLLDEGQGNFVGGLTTRKYVSLTKVGRATAVREINDLVAKKLLRQNKGKGRNVNYEIVYSNLLDSA